MLLCLYLQTFRSHLYVTLLVCTLPFFSPLLRLVRLEIFPLDLAVAAVRSVKVRVRKPVYLDCQPPDGLTQATDVTWWSGATMIPEQSETFSVLENGTLIIKAADYFLGGSYSCSVGETTTGHSAIYLLSVLGNKIVLNLSTPNWHIYAL